MARDITIKLFLYDELSKAAQVRAREWWRSGETDVAWSEHVTAHMKTIAALMGWTVTNTAFSGFSSQGDGAQFTGTWAASNVAALNALEAARPVAACDSNAGLQLIMRGVISLAESAPGTTASVWGNGHYSHSRSTVFDTPDLANGKLALLAELSRELMDWYYRELEIAHDDHFSDESVAEMIIANEYEFKANGDRLVV